MALAGPSMRASMAVEVVAAVKRIIVGQGVVLLCKEKEIGEMAEEC